MSRQQAIELKIKTDREMALKAGRRLVKCDPGDEIVISGFSGSFPNSDGLPDFANNLFNKVDLISDDNRRWTIEHPEIPQRTGKLNQINKFDAAFFGIHYKQAHTMDPMCRIILEKSYEAIVDSEINQLHPRNTRPICEVQLLQDPINVPVSCEIRQIYTNTTIFHKFEFQNA